MKEKIGTVIFLLSIVTCTQIDAQKIVPRPAECGTTRGCFSDCEGGSTCGFVVLWNVDGSNAVYTMRTSLLTTTAWMALGFSNDTTMANDDIILFAPYSNGTYGGFSGHTPLHSRPTLYTDTELTLTASSNQNGILSCTIQRPINASANGRVNANTPWILLLAVGNTTFTTTGDPSISYHRSNRFWSSGEVSIANISNVGAVSVHPTTPAPTAGPQPAGCGVSMGCFSDCQGSTCNFVVSWAVSGTTVTYNLTSAIFPTGGTWMAIGFSNNTEMDNDDVLGCASDASGIVKFSGINGNEAPPKQYVDGEVTLTSSSVQNGALMCSIQRPISASTTTGRVNADTAWTLLFAKGPATIDATSRVVSIFYHEGNRYWSTQQARATTFIDSGALKEKTNIVPRPAECGSTRGCFSDCEGGSTCGFVVLWNVVGTNAVYTMTTSLLKAATWMALGFSNDTTMEDDDVIWCAPNSNGRYIGFSGHTPRHRRPIPYNDTDLTLTASSNQNGILSCTIQRPINASDNGRVNANTPWILLFAVGDTQFTAAGEPNISYHGRINRFWSSAEVNITNTSDVGAESVHPVTPSPTTGAIEKPKDCGTSVGCFSSCQASGCNFVVSWTSDGVNAFYSFITNLQGSSGTWIAIGFSNDAKMGDDDVLGCATDASNAVSSFTAHNNVQSPPAYRTDDEVKLTNGSVVNNVLACTVQRPIAGTANGRRDVNQTWIYLVAKGEAGLSGGKVQIKNHQSNRFILNQQVSVNDKLDVGASTLDFPLIKAHGSLMIVAWIFLASIGIVLARYYKPVWTGLLCSEKVWFQVHRICMILVFCTTAAGFIIIFIQVDGYSEINEEREFLVGHPIIGIIVMILTVINPVMALFRPHPGTPRRPIFNWAHWFVGTAAHILGVVNIFFGVLLTKSDVPYYLVYILGAYVAWQIFVELLLEILTFFGRKMERSEAYEMDADSGAKKSVAVESSCTVIIKRVILIVHCIIVASFAAALIGLLATGKAELEDE